MKLKLTRKSYFNKKIIIFISIIFCFILFAVHKFNVIDEEDREAKLIKVDYAIKNHASLKACKQPILPVNSSEMNRFIKVIPPIDCTEADIDWVICENFECRIIDYVKTRNTNVMCSFTDLIRVNDTHVKEANTTHTNSYYKLERSDVVKVYCNSTNKTWSSVLTGIRLDEEIWERTGWQYVPRDGLQLNVLMFAFASISRNAFMRKLPKSYKYLTKELQGFVLEGYNIVGDGASQALTPMLTGSTELELPDVRKKYARTQFVNIYPFIWNDFQHSGYVTAYLEDTSNNGTYTNRLRGFDKPPTDHFMTPYYLSISKQIPKWRPFCAGSIPRHAIMLNYIKHFFAVYESKPKFLFAMHAELSRNDYNLIGAADDDLVNFLKNLYESGSLNNTLLMLFSDHGHRFPAIRNTIQGKQEERLPFFSFRFPPEFKHRHTSIYENFLSNINKLTTPFDIHATLKNVLHYELAHMGSLKSRSISLFSKIPMERSCAHAHLQPHWCACLDWSTIDINLPIVDRLSNKFVETINSYLKYHLDICHSWALNYVVWVVKLIPNEDLIKFEKSADEDGFIPDMSSKLHIEIHTYQMKFSLFPGDSMFEATLTHHLSSDRLELKENDISRINKYDRQYRCLSNSSAHIRKYCYCKHAGVE